MDAQEFKAVQKKFGLNNREMAEMILLSERMVEDMRAGRRKVSAQTERLIEWFTVSLRRPPSP